MCESREPGGRHPDVRVAPAGFSAFAHLSGAAWWTGPAVSTAPGAVRPATPVSGRSAGVTEALSNPYVKFIGHLSSVHRGWTTQAPGSGGSRHPRALTPQLVHNSPNIPGGDSHRVVHRFAHRVRCAVRGLALASVRRRSQPLGRSDACRNCQCRPIELCTWTAS